MVGKQDPLSENPSRGGRHVGTANGGSWKRSSGSPSRGWPHPWNPQRVLRGRVPSVSAPPPKVLVLVTVPTHLVTQDQGPTEESSLRMTRQHHKITTGSAVRRAPPRTRHENRRTESSDRQSPVSLRCRFPIVNGRTRGFLLGRWLATWGCCVVSAGRASGTGRGREGEGRGSSPTLFYFLFFFDREV